MSTQQWEYLVVSNEGTFSIKIDGVKYAGGISEYLNLKGKEGWELCGVMRDMVFYFKRPIQQS